MSDTMLSVVDLLNDIVAEYGLEDSEDQAGWAVDPAQRYLLIESSVVTGQMWLTTFDTTAQAADYHLNQESADDWRIERMIDLTSGEELTATYSLAFQ